MPPVALRSPRLRTAQSSEGAAAASAQVRSEARGTFADLAVRLGLPAYGPLTLPGEWLLA